MSDKAMGADVARIVTELITCTCPENRHESNHWNSCPTWQRAELIDAIGSLLAAEVERAVRECKNAVRAGFMQRFEYLTSHEEWTIQLIEEFMDRTIESRLENKGNR